MVTGRTRMKAPQYRADQVGSLLLPPERLAARDEGHRERPGAVKCRTILYLLTGQKELGFEIFTDGEAWRAMVQAQEALPLSDKHSPGDVKMEPGCRNWDLI
jgi:methionine synthase II (cobalamin-independent)